MRKYQEIVQFFSKAIQQQILQPGERLPSIRQLCQEFQCSKETVQKALRILTEQHYLYVKSRSGYYVLGQEASLPEKQLTSLPQPASSQAHQALEDFRICLNESLTGHDGYLFNYLPNQQGLPALIDSMVKLLASYHVYVKHDQLVITSGTQQALYILSQMPFPNGKTKILLEQPTYHRMNTLVTQQNLPYETIERTLAGFDLTALEAKLAQGDIKFIYIIPRFHNPLGTQLSLTMQQALIALAERYDTYIVEDDYMGDFDAKGQPAMHYWDQHERIIYLKSFTSTIFSSLRMGAVALPTSLVAPFLAIKNLIDYDHNLIMQKALSLYLDNGMFALHRKQLLALHLEKVELLQTALEQAHIPFSPPLNDVKLALSFPQSAATKMKYDFPEPSLSLNQQLIPLSQAYLQINVQELTGSQLTDYLQYTLEKIKDFNLKIN